MIFNFFLKPFLVLTALMFSRYSSSGSSQPPPPPYTSVMCTRQTSAILMQKQSDRVSTSQIKLINKWKNRLQSYSLAKQADKRRLDLSILGKERALYESQKSDADLDLYTSFINLKKFELVGTSVNLEKHHIIPRFAGGGNETDNIVLLTPEDHVIAHFLRYLEYGNSEDASVVLFRSGYDEEARRVLQEKALKKMKEEKKGRWDSEAQRQRGQKGGHLGGSANTQAQRDARQRGGKKFGQQTGRSNQSDALKEILGYTLVWVHSDQPNEIFYTNPSTSAKEIIDQLENLIPGKITNQTSFYKVLHGERKKMYGWQLVDKAIRSEAEGGKGPSERSETSM
jgi:5-methylcytosine-specific restriction endonuclease McrA